MSPLQHFERHLLRNYLIGSFVAVFGVGCLFIFETLTFTGIEQLILIGIMAASVSLMFSLEYMLYSDMSLPYAAFSKTIFLLSSRFKRPIKRHIVFRY